jgi:hypothetical protein
LQYGGGGRGEDCGEAEGEQDAKHEARAEI